MLEPQDIISLPGVPPEIKAAGNVLWHYLGEVEPGHPHASCYCDACARRKQTVRYDVMPPIEGDPVPVVVLKRYMAILADGRKLIFFTACGWMPWRKYVDRVYGGMPVCEDGDSDAR